MVFRVGADGHPLRAAADRAVHVDRPLLLRGDVPVPRRTGAAHLRAAGGFLDPRGRGLLPAAAAEAGLAGAAPRRRMVRGLRRAVLHRAVPDGISAQPVPVAAHRAVPDPGGHVRPAHARDRPGSLVHLVYPDRFFHGVDLAAPPGGHCGRLRAGRVRLLPFPRIATRAVPWCRTSGSAATTPRVP